MFVPEEFWGMHLLLKEEDELHAQGGCSSNSAAYLKIFSILYFLTISFVTVERTIPAKYCLASSVFLYKYKPAVPSCVTKLSMLLQFFLVVNNILHIQQGKMEIL